MDIAYSCPNCNTLQTADSDPGATVECPVCSWNFDIPNLAPSDLTIHGDSSPVSAFLAELTGIEASLVERFGHDEVMRFRRIGAERFGEFLEAFIVEIGSPFAEVLREEIDKRLTPFAQPLQNLDPQDLATIAHSRIV